MAAKKTNQLQTIVLALLVLLASSSAVNALDQPVVWTGNGDGVNWSDPANWDLLVVPKNQGAVTFNVTIPAGETVTFDVAGDSQIDNFTLGDSGSSDAQLIIDPNCNLEVIVGTATNIYDFINGQGGDFTSVADSDSLDGDRNRIYAQNGSHITISDTDFNSTGFCAEGFGTPTHSWDIITVTGVGSTLNLSTVQSFNAGFNSGGDDPDVHRITISDGGTLNFSSLQTITAPNNSQDSINITVDGGIIFFGDTIFNGNTARNTTINTNNGGHLFANSISATQSVLITLNDPNDLFGVAGDFDLSDKITISNPGDGTFVFGGDYKYSHTDETKLPLANSRVYFNGSIPQILEVGGLDVDILTHILTNDNFGFGQMIIGRCGQPSEVYLVDNIDNGNGAEALYLFGKDGEDGLRILDGSTLYMGNLHVYAMIDGVITDLRTLFGPGETCIPFDEGTLCLGYPDVDGVDNLITNGGFEYGVNPPNAVDPCVPLPVDSNNITGWTVVQNGIDWIHEAYFTDPCDPCDSERTVDLSGTAVGKGSISQEVETVPGNLYHLFFDLGANPYGNLVGDAGEKFLNVSAADESAEFSFDSTNNVGPDPGQGNPWQVYWQKKTWRFIATEETTTLIFASVDPNTEYGVAIDNVIVHDVGIYGKTGDLDLNGQYDVNDLAFLLYYWLEYCGWNDCDCDGADINRDGIVNFIDYALLTGNRLEGVIPPDKCGLVLSSTEGGSVTEPGEGAYLYDCGAEVIVVATADDCNHFVAWTGTAVDAGKVGDPCSPGTSVTVDDNYTLQANFAIDQFDLDLSSTEGGSVTEPGEGAYMYDCGAEVTVVATADNFNHFVAWTGTAVDAGKVGDPCSPSTTVTVDNDYTLQANFEMNPYSIVFENNLDTNPAWPTQGQWSFGVPNGAGGGLFGYPDPTSGYTGSNVFGVNLNGDYDTAIGGPYHLTAGPFDLSGIHEVELHFADWLNTDNPNYVVHKLEISTDASNWSTIGVHSGVDDITSNEWEVLSYDISNIADDESSVYIRWGYEVTTERAYPYSGWNIDDIQLWGRALIQ